MVAVVVDADDDSTFVLRKAATTTITAVRTTEHAFDVEESTQELQTGHLRVP